MSTSNGVKRYAVACMGGTVRLRVVRHDGTILDIEDVGGCVRIQAGEIRDGAICITTDTTVDTVCRIEALELAPSSWADAA